MTLSLTGALLAATTTPTPTRAPDPDSVTPGVAGFLVIFVLALITWLLMRNMTGRLRRLRYREDQRLANERAASPESSSPDPVRGTDVPGSDRSHDTDDPTHT